MVAGRGFWIPEIGTYHKSLLLVLKDDQDVGGLDVGHVGAHEASLSASAVKNRSRLTKVLITSHPNNVCCTQGSLPSA